MVIVQTEPCRRFFCLRWSPSWNGASDPNSYGFRKGRSTHDARSQLFVSLSKKASAQWVLDADISGFFDNINHDWLLNHVHMDKVMLNKWLKSGVVDAGQLQRTDDGTPQGGIISPTLANVTLNGLEVGLMQFLREKLKTKGVMAAKVNLVRYADDCAPRRRTGGVILLSSHAAQEMRAGPSKPAYRRRLQTTHCCCA